MRRRSSTVSLVRWVISSSSLGSVDRVICPDFGGVEILESVGVVGVGLIFLDVGE
jgi:hypothetical protein